MIPVRPKKHLGQHFLNDENIALRITESITLPCNALLEVGPGTGVLTKHLLKHYQPGCTSDNTGSINEFLALDVDRESISYLKSTWPQFTEVFREADFLTFSSEEYFKGCYTVIGNFPYNISSQIFFRILDQVDMVTEVVCMLQKEVAERIAAPPGSKTYGILSVLLQAWYNIEYLFTVNEHVFIPPPKVKSAVIRLRRNASVDLGCDGTLFKKVVKTAFNQRRKTLRNSLKSINLKPSPTLDKLLELRAERLTVADFVYITNQVEI